MTSRSTTHDRSWRTSDRGPPGRPEGEVPTRGFLTVEDIGPHRARMKNGYLVCYDVPIARTGWMLYAPGEVPVQPNPTSPSVYVERTPDNLFAPETVASFMGAAVTIGHPDFTRYPAGVTPDNFKELACGYAVNPRRGKDGDEDVLLCDLVITRRDLIKEIEAGKREISAGYDADYITVRPGIGRQANIIGNHIALVEKGRCGPRCAIGDQSPNQEHHMPDKQNTRRRLDAASIDSMQEFIDGQRRHLTMDSDDDSHIHVHVHTGPAATADSAAAAAATADGDPDQMRTMDVDKRIGAVEKMVGDLCTTVGKLGESVKAFVSGKTGDAATAAQATDDAAAAAATAAATAAAAAAAVKVDDPAMTGDSAALATSWTELHSKAELLVPGFKMPTFDSATPRKLTVDSMCKTRMHALELFGATAGGAETLKALTGDAACNIADMTCPERAVLFNAAAAYTAKANNAAATRDSKTTPVVAAGPANAVDVTSLNEVNQKFWANLNARPTKA